MDIKKIGKELLSVVFKYETFTQKNEISEMLAYRLNEIRLKQRRQRRLVAYSVAATVVIFITVGSYMFSDSHFQTQGGILAVVLPDNSKVQLGANSSLSYNRIMWHLRRNVRLKGDARFKVMSGERFSVQTALGDVRVLGTEFSVCSSIDRLDVECFEGNVEVNTKISTTILHHGDIIECTPTETIFTPRPDYYQFSHASLDEVLGRIESIYGVIILHKESYADVTFDGVITTLSLTEALDVLTLSCDMSYRIENDMITITDNE